MRILGNRKKQEAKNQEKEGAGAPNFRKTEGGVVHFRQDV